MNRVFQLQELLLKRECIFISNAITVRYLSKISFFEDAYILILPDKVYLISDSRYRQELLQISEPFTAVEIEVDLFSTIKNLLPKRIAYILVEGKFPIGWQAILEKKTGRRVVFSKDIDKTLRKMRAVKDKEEIKLLKSNFRLHHSLLEKWQEGIVGLTEFQAAVRWYCLALEAGCEGVGFWPIVAVGSSASRPHYRSANRRITTNKPILFDAGITRKGYKTDLTRMFFTARINQRFRHYINLIREAQEIAFSCIRPGVPARDVDETVRKFLRSAGVDKYFVHGLGHGIGLEIHEAPRVCSRSEDVLEVGMVFTVEPGLYIPGKFGARIEDVVVVTDKGCEVISR